MDDRACPHCGHVLSAEETVCPICRTSFDQAPPPIAYNAYVPNPPLGNQDFSTALIPSQNPDSLWAYYLGLFSIFPIFGLFMGLVGMVKGKRALSFAKAHPEVKGKAHAYVGIGCGLIGFLFNLSIVLLLIAAMLSKK